MEAQLRRQKGPVTDITIWIHIYKHFSFKAPQQYTQADGLPSYLQLCAAIGTMMVCCTTEPFGGGPKQPRTSTSLW